MHLDPVKMHWGIEWILNCTLHKCMTMDQLSNACARDILSVVVI